MVVGASAGGVQAVQQLVGGLPADFPAAVFVVVHSSPASRGMLAQLLTRAGPLPALVAEDGAPVEGGHIYVAAPDQHLLLRGGHMHLSHGPKENSARPAVNPLFRTAASAYGSRVVGVVLSGNLDDGTAGLLAIADAGGITIVQDPGEAAYPGMPSHALESVGVDHVLPLAEIAPLLVRLAREPRAAGEPGAGDRAPAVPPEDGMGWKGSYAEPGHAAGFSCPECHGPLWEIREGELLEFGCLIGHRYSPENLMSASAQEIEQMMGMSLRALEERVRMAERLAESVRARGKDSRTADRRLREAEGARRMSAQIRAVIENGAALTP